MDFESSEFSAIVDEIVRMHKSIEQHRLRRALIFSYRDSIRNNPAVWWIDHERYKMGTLEAYQRAAKKLGFEDIDFPKEAEQLSETIS